MIRVKVLLMRAPYILFIFQVNSKWYGLSREIRRNKRVGRAWSVKRIILSGEKMSVGINDKNLDIVFTDSIRKDTLWYTEVEIGIIDLWRSITIGNTPSLLLRQELARLFDESTRESME
jgi:hypothetical protein